VAQLPKTAQSFPGRDAAQRAADLQSAARNIQFDPTLRRDWRNCSFQEKNSQEKIAIRPKEATVLASLLDSLSVSRSGKSSSERSSVMIRNPTVGNSLKQGVSLEDITT
jgi:hypothetical protein